MAALNHKGSTFSSIYRCRFLRLFHVSCYVKHVHPILWQSVWSFANFCVLEFNPNGCFKTKWQTSFSILDMGFFKSFSFIHILWLTRQIYVDHTNWFLGLMFFFLKAAEDFHQKTTLLTGTLRTPNKGDSSARTSNTKSTDLLFQVPRQLCFSAHGISMQEL